MKDRKGECVRACACVCVIERKDHLKRRQISLPKKVVVVNFDEDGEAPVHSVFERKILSMIL